MMSLERHIDTCPTCRRRLEREGQLEEIRRQQATPNGGVAGAGEVVYTSMRSPLGILWLAGSERGLLQISFGVDEATFARGIEMAGYGIPSYDPDALPEVVEQFSEYFAGRRTAFDLPVDLRQVGPFQRAVLEAVRAIPYGSVRSYGQIADDVGRPRAARAVGTAVASNPMSLIIPCHRVVRSDGKLGEYAMGTLGSCGVVYKASLLDMEAATLAVGVEGR